MSKERKALIVRFDPHSGDGASLDTLNQHLADGWLPLATTAMGGGGDDQIGDGPHFAALVILERETDFNVSGFGR
ncbi:MAG: hypothetical protein AAFQ53_15630 [Bacteroidota bacterium]